jgi:hypothetical protein
MQFEFAASLAEALRSYDDRAYQSQAR